MSRSIQLMKWSFACCGTAVVLALDEIAMGGFGFRLWLVPSMLALVATTAVSLRPLYVRSRQFEAKARARVEAFLRGLRDRLQALDPSWPVRPPSPEPPGVAVGSLAALQHSRRR